MQQKKSTNQIVINIFDATKKSIKFTRIMPFTPQKIFTTSQDRTPSTPQKNQQSFTTMNTFNTLKKESFIHKKS
jgi:hypothetical protein